jgi:hypothetical protein
MPALTRRRDPEALQETWLIYFSDVPVGRSRSARAFRIGIWGCQVIGRSASTAYCRGHAAMAIPIRMMAKVTTIQFRTPKIVKSWTSQSPIEALRREAKGR